MIKQALMVGVIACLTAVSAFAGDASKDREMRFSNLDQNRDGHIDFYEARGKHRVYYYYSVADKNEDGQLDKAEFSAFEMENPDLPTQ